MLEGYAERLLEVTQHVEGGVGVLDIVVGEFLALDLLGEGQGERGGFQGGVELGALVGVLAVAEALLEVVLQEEFLIEAGSLSHIGGDAGIVLGRVGIGLGRELQAGLVRSLPVSLELFQDGIVVGGVAHDGHVLPVLGGAAHHGRTADVDVLDGLGQGDTLLGDGLLEGIEVHADELDGLDAVLLQGLHVCGNVAAGQDAAVYLRVKGLDTSVADFRETGYFADADGLHTLGFQQFLGTARGDDFPAKVYKALHEGHKTVFVAYTN